MWPVAQHSVASEVAGTCAEHTHLHTQAYVSLFEFLVQWFTRARPRCNESSCLRGDEVALCGCLCACGFLLDYISSWLMILFAFGRVAINIMDLLDLFCFQATCYGSAFSIMDSASLFPNYIYKDFEIMKLNFCFFILLSYALYSFESNPNPVSSQCIVCVYMLLLFLVNIAVII